MTEPFHNNCSYCTMETNPTVSELRSGDTYRILRPENFSTGTCWWTAGRGVPWRVGGWPLPEGGGDFSVLLALLVFPDGWKRLSIPPLLGGL